MRDALENDLSSSEDRYWMGFAAGALIGTAAAVAGFVLTNALSGRSDRRVVRLEDSVQIGAPLEQVFAAWQRLENLPNYIDIVKNVRVNGSHSQWEVNIDGKRFHWDAETTQVIPNQAIGWKSVQGPKHSGRLSFSRIGDQTLLHITMNYAPPLSGLARLLSPFASNLDAHISQALRDFKNSLEGGSVKRRPGSSDIQKDPARAEWRRSGERATGTLGRQTGPVGSPNDTERSGFVNYNRPPKSNYP